MCTPPRLRISLRELMHALVRQPQQPCGIASTHLQASPAQHTHGVSGRQRRAAIFALRLLAKCRVGADRLRGPRRKLNVVYDLGRPCSGERRLLTLPRMRERAEIFKVSARFHF